MSQGQYAESQTDESFEFDRHSLGFGRKLEGGCEMLSEMSFPQSLTLKEWLKRQLGEWANSHGLTGQCIICKEFQLPSDLVLLLVIISIFMVTLLSSISGCFSPLMQCGSFKCIMDSLICQRIDLCYLHLLCALMSYPPYSLLWLSVI